MIERERSLSVFEIEPERFEIWRLGPWLSEMEGNWRISNQTEDRFRERSIRQGL